MSFLVPTMLWGAVAGGIPVIIHLLFRTHYRRIPWAAMKFLLDSIEQTARRLRFQELLLLLVRIALLVLLALTLARPMSSLFGVAGGGDAVDAVFVFDVSYSMDSREGRMTRLETAQAAAQALLDQLPLNSTVQVITVADRANRWGPRLPARSAQARQLIESLEVTHLGTDFLPGIAEASVAFQQGDTANKELYLFSDMQPQGWERQPADLVAKLQDLHARASLYLVQCGTRAPRNVAVVGLIPQSGMPHVGERVPFTVLLKNTGRETVRNLTVTLAANEEREKETQALAEVLPGETKSLTAMARLGRPGLQVVSAALKQDELSADNHVDRVIEVREKVRLLIVDGAPAPGQGRPEKAASFYLLHALLPVAENERYKYHVQPQLVTPRQATAQRLANTDACILVNVALEAGADRENLSPAFVDALADFVREGHGLLIFGGDRVTPAAYNAVFAEMHDLLPCKLGPSEVLPAASAARLDRHSAAPASPFAVFADDEYYQALAGVEVRGRLGAGPMPAAGDSGGPSDAAACRVLFRYSDGRPAVAARRVGRGQVVLVTTSADVSWTDWPRWQGMYVPFVDRTLRCLLGEQSSEHNLTAGEAIRFRLPDNADESSCVLIDPRGKSTPLGPAQSVEGRPVVTARDTSLAGAYRMTWSERFGSASAAYRSGPAGLADRGKSPTAPFAVVPNLAESETLEPLPTQDIDARLGFQPIHLIAGEDPSGFAPRRQASREWSLYFLLGVCGLCLSESALAWYCGRAR